MLRSYEEGQDLIIRSRKTKRVCLEGFGFEIEEGIDEHLAVSVGIRYT